MSLTLEQLAEEALALPASVRAELVDRLVESLDPVEDIPLHQLGAVEAIRRRGEVRSGRVQTIPGDLAIRSAREAASG